VVVTQGCAHAQPLLFPARTATVLPSDIITVSVIMALDCTIILVEPSEPGNIGATARAMKAMGLSRLALVRPRCDHLQEQAWWMAYRAQEVLRAAQCHTSLAAAIDACHCVAACTGRTRLRTRLPRMTMNDFAAREAAPLLQRQAPIALVFGSERCGLARADMELCTHIVTIPVATRTPSLNLSQAVMIACYELQRHACVTTPRTTEPAATREQVARLLDDIQAALATHGRVRGQRQTTFVHALRRMLARTQSTPADLRVLHTLVKYLDAPPPAARMQPPQSPDSILVEHRSP